jgi:chromosome segregation ATPase
MIKTNYMKKVVFEGTVNGKKFDNIQEYNAEVQRILADGGSLETYSSTKTVDTDDLGEDTKSLYPLFESSQDLNNLNDSFLSDNIDIRAVTQSVRELISTRIAQMYDDELTNYETKIHQILDFLTTTENHEVYTLDFISRQLSNLHKQIDQLNSEISSLGSRHDAVADRVDRAKSARDIYNTILAAILKRQAALRLEVPGESQTAASTIDVTDENVENYRKGIRKLVQAIFG